MNRRGFLLGMAGILATATAPAIVRATTIMPVAAPLPASVAAWEWTAADNGLLMPDSIFEALTVITQAVGAECDKKHLADLWQQIQDRGAYSSNVIAVSR